MDSLSDDSNSGIAEDSLKESIRASQINIHTMLPGEIVAFYPLTQTADVQVCIQKDYNGKVEPLDVLMGLPVRFPKAGGYAITFPVKPGDECEVRFCERSIDEWFLNGGCQDPKDSRLHDLSDGVVDVGLHSEPNALEDFDTTSFVIRSGDNEQTIKLHPTNGIILSQGTNSVKLGSDDTVKIQTTKYELKGGTDELMLVLEDLTTVLAAAVITGTVFNPATITAITAIKTRIIAMKA